MKRNREVHSLDYALCVLVSLLNRVFSFRCGNGGWWNIHKGLNIKIRKTMVRNGTHSAIVCIRPVGWEDDEHIEVRCVQVGDDSDDKWWPVEGVVCHPGLIGRFGHRRFRFETEPNMLSLKTHGTLEEDFLKEECPEWS